MRFIRCDEHDVWLKILSERGLSLEIARRCIEMRLLPVYVDNDIQVVWENDLLGVPVEWTSISAPGWLPFVTDVRDSTWSLIRFRNGISVVLSMESIARDFSGIGPALRALALLETLDAEGVKVELAWISGSSVTVPHSSLVDRVVEMANRMVRIGTDRTSELTQSAYYMGSKYALASFLVEGVSSVLPENGVVVDLMCGSGSASRAFSNCWDVLACDAMSFCTNLAASVGYHPAARDLINALPSVHAAFRENMDRLDFVYQELVSEEETLLHSPLGFDEGLGEAYADFLDRTPRFPESGHVGTWSISDEVSARRKMGNQKLEPYCLMVSYFGNVYFGLRQAMELDSLRFAIDSLVDDDMRAFALAAIVATASYLGTGYASQFAQPINVRGLSKRKLFALLERRAVRVFPEFSARIAALLDISAESRHEVTAYTGPWELALSKIDAFAGERTTCVYVDAPYTRDEYARYYHVLETMCRYHYPDATGHGRVPARRDDQMFRSPFFTRRDNTVAPLIGDIIVGSLRVSSYCAWSYSSRARASIPDVVRYVLARGGELIRSFAIAHRYNGQGRTDRRFAPNGGVDEYLLVFGRGVGFGLNSESVAT